MAYTDVLAGGAAICLVAAGLAGCSSEAADRSAEQVTTTPSATTSATTAHEWSYSGEAGPDTWGAVSPTCAASETGAQSPIDITVPDLVRDDDVDRGLRTLEIRYAPTTFAVENTGHTIEAVPDDLTAGSVVIDGTTYDLQQLHLHSPSEHQIDGVEAPMELHLVNRADDGSVAVLGVLLQVGDENPVLSELFASMPTSVTDEEHRVHLAAPIDSAAFVDDESRVAEYTGSLTTPPCTEGVLWTVFDGPLEISQAQLDAFLAIYPDNHRPVQALNGRDVVAGPGLQEALVERDGRPRG